MRKLTAQSYGPNDRVLRRTDDAFCGQRIMALHCGKKDSFYSPRRYLIDLSDKIYRVVIIWPSLAAMDKHFYSVRNFICLNSSTWSAGP